MSIRLAMSTQACPEWPVAQAIEQAQAMGYQGIELVTHFGPDTPRYACDAQQGDAAELRKRLDDAGIEPVCLTTNISLSCPDESLGLAAMHQTRSAIVRAAELGCPAVRVMAHRVTAGRGELPRVTLSRSAERARSLAEFAAGHGVQILFENNADFPAARDWWWCMDVARNPMVGLAWHVEPAGLAGEQHAVALPMLHSRIRLVKASDVTLSQPPVAMPVGQGDLQLEKMLHRLMGLGYDGFISVTWDRLERPWLASPMETLAVGRQQFADWLTAIAEAAQPKKPARRAATLPGIAAAKAAQSAKPDAPTTDGQAPQAKPEAQPAAKPDAKPASSLRAAAMARLATSKADQAAPPAPADGDASPPVTPPSADAKPAADKPAMSLREAAKARIAAAKAAQAQAGDAQPDKSADAAASPPAHASTPSADAKTTADKPAMSLREAAKARIAAAKAAQAAQAAAGDGHDARP